MFTIEKDKSHKRHKKGIKKFIFGTKVIGEEGECFQQDPFPLNRLEANSI